MRLLASRAIAVSIAGLAFVGATGSANASQVLKLNLNNPQNDTHIFPDGAPAQSAPLTAGAPYVIQVLGTGSIWARGAYGQFGTCGVAERTPIEETPGAVNAPASWDAATVFASPIGAVIGPIGIACKGLKLPTSTPANLYAGFQLTAGAKYDRPRPVGGYRSVPRSDHTYTYQVTGTGAPARFRFADSPSIDNSGAFTITVLTADECNAIGCLAQADPSNDQKSAPRVGAAVISTSISGTRQCTGEKVLTVRLKQPKGVSFQKAAYFINSKKKKTVGHVAMFVPGTKGKTIKAQKFRNLPSGQLKLRVEVTTKAGQRLSIRKTIKRCEPQIKAKTIAF